MTSRAVVAVDVGGTKIRAGAVIDGTIIDGTMGHIREVPTPASEGRSAILDAIAEVAREVMRSTDASIGADTPLLWKLGIGAAGVIDSEAGTVVSATDSLTGWAGTRLTAELTARLGLETRAVNDVHAHALGESFAGAARGSRSSLLVAAGTGIGGAFISEGRLLTGRNFAAGHIGHLPVAAAQGLPCPCDGAGHVEAIASGPAVLAAYRRAGGRADVSSTRELAGVARSGDVIAQEAFARAGETLGSILGGLANVLSPEVVVIGGGLAGTGELWWSPLCEAFDRELIPAIRGLELREAQLGSDAALIGAASLWSAATSAATSAPKSPMPGNSAISKTTSEETE